MTAWQREQIEEIVTSQNFRVCENGPMLGPISNFTITRGDHSELILETVVDGPNKQRDPREYPIGTIRETVEKVELEGHGQWRCTLEGVSPFSQNTTWDARGTDQIREKAKVHAVKAILRENCSVAYTIDWLDNLDTSGIWIGTHVADHQETCDTRKLGRSSETVLTTRSVNRQTGSNRALEMVIGGVRLYLAGSDKEFSGGIPKAGYILYFGSPAKDIRERIRDALAFTLGNYLIYLGSSMLDETSQLVGLDAISPSNIELTPRFVVRPPAPLGVKIQNEVNQRDVERFADAVFTHYDELRFRSLSWAYWHAACAPLHMAAAHYGAALEGLRDSYMEAHSSKFPTKLVADDVWSPLKDKLLAAIDAANLDADAAKVLANKVKSNLNQAPSTMRWAKMLEEIGIVLGEAEMAAWRRRNSAAHGGSVDITNAIQTIKDTKLLKIILHRLVLKIAGASEHYRDDYTIGHPIRRISDPIPSEPAPLSDGNRSQI